MTQSDNPPGLVNWTGYLAITFLLVVPLAVLTVRSGAWQQGLLLYTLACLGSSVMLLLCLSLLLFPRFAPWRLAIALRALVALPATLLVLSLLGSGGGHPPIHDITTDTQDPPAFDTAPQQRGSDANPLDINPEAIQQQREAYPEVQPLRSALSIEAAFSRAVQVARELGWEIYHQDHNRGIIEAVDTTPIMAFKDDIVIRVRGDAGGSLLDLRSVSRVGVGDIGANAERIRAFVSAFDDQGQ